MAIKYEFTIPCRPISVNQSKKPFISKSSAFTKLRFAPTDEFKEAKRNYHNLLIFHKNRLRELLESEKAFIYGFHFEFYYYLDNVYTKKGKINQKCGDLDNFLKGVIDAIFSMVQSDDSTIMKITTEKIHSTEEKIVVKISEYLKQ